MYICNCIVHVSHNFVFAITVNCLHSCFFCFRALSTQQGGYVRATNLYYYYYYYYYYYFELSMGTNGSTVDWMVNASDINTTCSIGCDNETVQVNSRDFFEVGDTLVTCNRSDIAMCGFNVTVIGTCTLKFHYYSIHTVTIPTPFFSHQYFRVRRSRYFPDEFSRGKGNDFFLSDKTS